MADINALELPLQGGSEAKSGGHSKWSPAPDTSPQLERLLARYQRNRRAIPVSFRALIPWMKPDRGTHYLHPYPAKLLPQIAHFFSASNLLSSPGDVILDPFGGTGTVALEALLCGRNAFYSDINPLARLIAKVKTSPLNVAELKTLQRTIQQSFSRKRDTALDSPNVVSGLETLILMSQGIPRNLLSLLKHIYRRAHFADEHPFTADRQISITSQIEGIRDSANWFWDDAQPDSFGTEVRTAVESLAKLCHGVRYSLAKSRLEPMRSPFRKKQPRNGQKGLFTED